MFQHEEQLLTLCYVLNILCVWVCVEMGVRMREMLVRSSEEY